MGKPRENSAGARLVASMWYSPRPARGRRGFTLVELMMVLVILAIGAAIALPQLGAMSEFGANSAARILAADIQYAQDFAITNQQPVTVSFNTVNETYRLDNESGPLIHPINKTDYVVGLSAQKGFEGFDIVTANFAGDPEVTFDEMGSPISGGSVRLQAGPYVYQVDVAAATGKVTVVTIGS